MGSVDCHFLARPLMGKETECGDIGVIRVEGARCFLALVDAVGHGPVAYDIACLARGYLEEHSGEDLIALMQGLHEHLKGTHGAVAACCRLRTDTGELEHVGIGNITVKLLGARDMTFVPRDGVLGYLMPGPRGQHHQLSPGDILLMFSDGVRQTIPRWEFSELSSGDAATIAQGLLTRYGKRDDDASCLVVRYL